MKKQFFKNAFLLTLGGFICKFAGAFYKIPLANILGANGIGIYQILFPVYSFLLVFVSGGLPTAMAKYIASARAYNQEQKIKRFFLIGFFACFLIGALFAISFLLFAKRLAIFQGEETIYRSYYALAPTIFFSCLIVAFRGLFQGYENMFPTFFSQVLEVIFKLFFGLFLSAEFAKKGLEWGIFGAFLGLAISEIISFLFLIIYTFRSKELREAGNNKEKLFNNNQKIFNNSKNESKGEIRGMLKFTLTLTLSSLFIPLMSAFQGFSVVKLLNKSGFSQEIATTLFGIETGIVGSIINFPTIFSTALAIILIPSLSFHVAKNNFASAKNIIRKCFKTIWILTLPCVVGILLLAPNILNIAFSKVIPFEFFDLSVELMQVSSLSILFTSLAQISTVILQCLRQEFKVLLNLILLFVVNVVLVFVLVPKFAIVGLALANVFSFCFLCVLNMFFLKQKIGIEMNLKDILIPLIATCLMGLLVLGIKNLMKNYNDVFSSLLCVSVAVIFYFGVLFVFRILNFKDFKLQKNNLEKST